MWFDNIGCELQIGDYVLCLTGDYSYTVQRIEKFSQRDEGTYIRYMVSLECKTTVSAYNVISLTAMQISPDAIATERAGSFGFDVFGNAVNVGDRVLFLHRMEMYTEVGTVTK